jgi:hypothetical protein
MLGLKLGRVRHGPAPFTNRTRAATVTVLHFNNAGLVEDAMGHNWFGQNLLHSDNISKFGGGSALFNGNAWIATNDTPDFASGSENFTFSTEQYHSLALKKRWFSRSRGDDIHSGFVWMNHSYLPVIITGGLAS